MEYYISIYPTPDDPEEPPEQEATESTPRPLEASQINQRGLPYPWCSRPEYCRAKGYCARNPNCGE